MGAEYPPAVAHSWQDVINESGRGPSTTITGAATYIYSGASGLVLSTNTAAGVGTKEFSPAWYVLAGHSLMLRCIWGLHTNDVAPANSFTFGLYPVTAVGGVSGNNTTVTVGTVVPGTTGTFTTPSADTVATAIVVTEISAPSAGLYILGFTSTGASASGATVVARGRVQVRNVPL